MGKQKENKSHNQAQTNAIIQAQYQNHLKVKARAVKGNEVEKSRIVLSA